MLCKTNYNQTIKIIFNLGHTMDLSNDVTNPKQGARPSEAQKQELLSFLQLNLPVARNK